MSEARKLFLQQAVDKESTIGKYIEELEQQIIELKESQKQKQVIRLCQRLDKAVQQNKDLKNALKQCMTWRKKESKSIPHYDITQSVLWQKIEEVLNARD